MQKVFSDQTLLQVVNIKNLLEASHIAAEIRNEYAAGGVGELSFIDAWPELWVSCEDAARAKEIIAQYHVAGDGGEWLCVCGEKNGSAFASCWSCQADRPD